MSSLISVNWRSVADFFGRHARPDRPQTVIFAIEIHQRQLLRPRLRRIHTRKHDIVRAEFFDLRDATVQRRDRIIKDWRAGLPRRSINRSESRFHVFACLAGESRGKFALICVQEVHAQHQVGSERLIRSAVFVHADKNGRRPVGD